MPDVGSSVWPSQSSSFKLQLSATASGASQVVRPVAVQVRLPPHEPAAEVELQAVAPDRDDAGFMLFDTVLAFDHVRHRILIIANARITGGEDLESLYQFACAKIDFAERELERALSTPRVRRDEPVTFTSNLTQERFETMVRTAKEYIAAGDIYQVVLSQRFEADVVATPFTVSVRSCSSGTACANVEYLRPSNRMCS